MLADVESGMAVKYWQNWMAADMLRASKELPHRNDALVSSLYVPIVLPISCNAVV